MSDIRNNNLRKTSLPRTGRTLDAMAVSSVIGSGGNLDPSSVKPSSLWYPDKLREYFHLNEDNTITLLATDLIVEGHILSRKSITAYASDNSTPTWFDKLPVASHTSKGIVQIKENSGLIVTDGLISIDPKWKGNGKTYYAGTGLKLGTKTGSGETENEFAINFGKLAGTVVEGNDSRLSDGQKALDRLAACSWWGQKLPEDGFLTGALSGVTKINGIAGSDGSLGDLFLNYVSDTKNVRVDKDGNLIVSGNIKATGAIMAYATDGATREGPIAGYEDGALGMIRADSGQFTIDPATGLLKIKDGVIGGFGDIAFSGDGPFLSDVTPSADKRTLTFTRVGKPTYTALEVGAVNKKGDTMVGTLVVDGSVKIKQTNFDIAIVGAAGGWERGLMWNSTDFSKMYGSVTMFGNDSTPWYISMGFGAYNEPRRLYVTNGGNVGIGTSSPLDKFHVWGNARVEGNLLATGTSTSRGRIYAEDGITSYAKNINLGWDNWHYYPQPFNVPEVTVASGAYYPVISWSSLIPTGYRQYASIGSLRDGGFGKVAITVGSSDTNSTSAKFLFRHDGIFMCDRIATNDTIGAAGTISGNNGLYLSNLSANTHSHIRLVNSQTGRQWGIKSGYYMVNENDFTITNDSSYSTPAFRIDTGNHTHCYGNIYAEAGYLFSGINGHTIQIGSQNSGYCHYHTTAPIHWFNTRVEINGYLCPYDTTPRHHLGSTSNQWLEGHFYNWLRVYDKRGNEGGLYFQNWGGGITMQDSTYVKVYGNKCFLIDSSLYYSINNTGGYYRGTYQGNAWSNGRGALNVEIFNNGNQTPLIVAARGDGFENASSSRLFAMELLNSGSMMVFAFNAVQRFKFFSNGSFVGTAAVTAYSTNGSDMRRKTVINPRYDLDPRSLLKVWTFTYRWNQDKDDTPLVGMSAQQMLGIAPAFVMGATDEKGDYYTFDYGRFGAIGLVKTVRYVLPWMDRMDKWKDRKDREIETLRKAVRSQGRRITELEDIIQTLKAA